MDGYELVVDNYQVNQDRYPLVVQVVVDRRRRTGPHRASVGSFAGLANRLVAKSGMGVAQYLPRSLLRKE